MYNQKEIIKIMFVCHGNICRSPMAEFIMKDLLAKNHLSDKFYVASSATSTEEIYRGIGNPVYPPAKQELARHGISCEGKRAVQFTKSDFDNYDYIIAMDGNNIRNIQRIVGINNSDKLYMLLDFCGGGNIADPWYTGEFETTYNDIYRGCIALLEKLKK